MRVWINILPDRYIFPLEIDPFPEIRIHSLSYQSNFSSIKKFSYTDHHRQIFFSTNNQVRIKFQALQTYPDVDAILIFTRADSENTEECISVYILGSITFHDKVKMVGMKKGNRVHEVQLKFYPESVRCLPIVDLTKDEDEEHSIDFLFRSPEFGMSGHANSAFRVNWSLQGWSASDTDNDNCFVEDYKQLYGTWSKSYETKDGISFCIEPFTPDIAHMATLTWQLKHIIFGSELLPY